MTINIDNLNRRAAGMTIAISGPATSLNGKSLAKRLAALLGARRLALKNRGNSYDFSTPEVQRTYLSAPRGPIL